MTVDIAGGGESGCMSDKANEDGFLLVDNELRIVKRHCHILSVRNLTAPEASLR